MAVFHTPRSVIRVAQQTPKWKAIRNSVIISGSNAASAIGVKGAYESRYITAQKILKWEDKSETTRSEWLQAAMDHGNRLEPEAFNFAKRLLYWRYKLHLIHSPFLFHEGGLTGASPDGLLIDSRSLKVVGILEIKCPYSRELATAIKDIYKVQMYMEAGGIYDRRLCPVPRMFYFDYINKNSFWLNELSFDPKIFNFIISEIRSFIDLLKVHQENPDTFPKRVKSALTWEKIVLSASKLQ
jgi:hypothetical protein